ncbi:MAG TPA: patatin-like phospholipase family protein [Bacteroidales bacterium]|nr:patatin-like phospholipase family protein [Bacteroidales bacterium]
MVKTKKKFETGLVLSGGALRGFAHAGVLRALNEAGIYPDVISGVSAGSIVGALYADGYKPEEIYSIFINKSLYKFLEFIVPNRGLVRMTGLYKTLLSRLRARTFEDLNIPLIVTLTNLNEARIEYFSQGELVRYIIASCTIPVIFQPMVIDDITYIDGGVLNNLPLEPIENDCEMLIGVNVNPVRRETKFNGMTNVADRAINMALNQLMAHKIPKFDIFIEPAELHKFSMMDAAKGDKMYDIGYKETRKILKEKGF